MNVPRVEQAAEAPGKAMFTDAELGLLVRLVLAEIGREQSATEQYCSGSLAAAWFRRLSRMRAVERKLRRHREVLRAGRAAEPGPPGVDAKTAVAGPGPAAGEPGRRECAVGFMALGATERVRELLRSETAHRTIAGLARSAQVSRTTVAKVIRQLEGEGKLDVDRRHWPNGYLLEPAART